MIPVTGFTRVDGMASKEEHAMTTRTQCKHEHLIQHTCICSRASFRGQTFEACVLGRFKIVEGTISSRVVVEVVVHVRFEEVLDESNVFRAMVVVNVL